MVEAHGDFILVYVATPIEVCEAKGPEGVVRQGEGGGLEGVLQGFRTPMRRPSGRGGDGWRATQYQGGGSGDLHDIPTRRFHVAVW